MVATIFKVRVEFKRELQIQPNQTPLANCRGGKHLYYSRSNSYLTTQRKLNANSITTQTQTADVFAYSARETTFLTVEASPSPMHGTLHPITESQI
jgi:hypothetical protein